MGQSHHGIRVAKPDPKVYLTTAATTPYKLGLYERTVIVDASSGANIKPIILPPPGGVAEGAIVSVYVSGSTGSVNLKATNTSWTWNAGTTEERMSVRSDGYKWLAIFDDAD